MIRSNNTFTTVSNLSILECKSKELWEDIEYAMEFLIYPYWNVNQVCGDLRDTLDYVSNLSILECKC